MRKEYISFYQIAKELAEEEEILVDVYDPEREITITIKLVIDGKIQDQSKFNNYKKQRQKYIEEIFSKVNILDKYKVTTTNEQSQKKEIEFQIPVLQKEFVKFLLRQYTSPLSRKIRKEKINELSTEEIREAVDDINIFINENIPVAEQEKELVTAKVLTQLESRTVFDKVETGFLKMLGDDLSQVKVRDNELRISNDSDAAFLMYYYFDLLKKQSRFWNEIVDKVDELRTEEIFEMTARNVKGESILEEYKICDIREVVLRAHVLVEEDSVNKVRHKINRPTSEQLKKVEELLKVIGKL